MLEPYLEQFDRSVPHEHIGGSHSGQFPESPPGSFPTAAGGFTPLAPLAEPHTAGRIEAHPAQR